MTSVSPPANARGSGVSDSTNAHGPCGASVCSSWKTGSQEINLKLLRRWATQEGGPGTGPTSQYSVRMCADLAAAVDVAGDPRRRHAPAPQLPLAKLQQGCLQGLVLRAREEGVGRRAQQRVPARPIGSRSAAPGVGGCVWRAAVTALVLHVPKVPAEAVRGRLQRVGKAARARVGAPVPPVQKKSARKAHAASGGAAALTERQSAAASRARPRTTHHRSAGALLARERPGLPLHSLPARRRSLRHALLPQGVQRTCSSRTAGCGRSQAALYKEGAELSPVRGQQRSHPAVCSHNPLRLGREDSQLTHLEGTE